MRFLERETGLEPATSSLGNCRAIDYAAVAGALESSEAR